MTDRTPDADWWKVVPCHFIWKLEENVHVDFKAVVNNLDSKLETRNEREWMESACDMLLFRGYLEVSNFDGVQHNPQKAEEFFVEAENEAIKVTDDDERQAYITVVTANRLWVLESTQEGNHIKGRRSKLITDLDASWRHRNRVSQDKLEAFIDATVAFALARIGPNKYKEAERRYKRALKTIKTKSSWYQSLGEIIGRQGRLRSGSFYDKYDGMYDEIQCYERAIELDPRNNSAKCDLAMVLLKDRERTDEAKYLIDEVPENSCEVVLKKGRFYRRLKEPKRALEILFRGEALQNPRSELFLQISHIYQDLANQTPNQNWDEKTKYKWEEMKYIDKCLKLEPSHFNAKIKKAIAYNKLGRNEKAVEMFHSIINEYRSSSYNLIEAQDALANCLFIQNRKRCNEDTARAYEDVIDTAVHVMINIDVSGNDQIQVIVAKAKTQLEEYYDDVNGGAVRKQYLRNKLSEIGFDG